MVNELIPIRNSNSLGSFAGIVRLYRFQSSNKSASRTGRMHNFHQLYFGFAVIGLLRNRSHHACLWRWAEPMTPELTALTLAALLQVIQYALVAIPANMELGTGKTLSPRDRNRLGGDLQDQVSLPTARLIRALNNHFEGLILFTIACVVITLSDQSTPFTAACGWVYLAARVLYIPTYAFGLSPWRTIVWAIGFGATTFMLLAALI